MTLSTAQLDQVTGGIGRLTVLKAFGEAMRRTGSLTERELAIFHAGATPPGKMFAQSTKLDVQAERFQNWLWTHR